MIGCVKRWGALLTLATLSVGCSDTAGPSAPSATDRAFIDGIVPHHGMALFSADMAIARANHAELKTMAAEMKADQGEEIAQLKIWKKQWFGTDSTPTPMMPRDIPAGADFDLEWIKAMLTHHQGAIDISTLALAADGRPQTDSLASHIIDEQRKEQNQLRGWAKSWYGVMLVPGNPE